MCVFAAVGNDSGSIYTEDICISNLKLLFCSLLCYTVLFSLYLNRMSVRALSSNIRMNETTHDVQQRNVSLSFFPYWFCLSPTDFTMAKPTQILYSNVPHTMRRCDVYSHQTLVGIQVPKLF